MTTAGAKGITNWFRAFVKYSLLLLNLALAALLLCARLIPHINPYEYNILGLLGYLTPLLALTQIGFIVFWLINRKFLYLILPLSSLILTWPVIRVSLGTALRSSQDMQAAAGRFQVMSYNVRLLDYYNWSGKPGTRKALIRFLKTTNASIMCLQEFYTNDAPGGVNNLEAIRRACGYQYVAFCPIHVTPRGQWGSVIFSHLPIVNTENISIDAQGNNQIQKVEINLGKDTFHVYNIHLKSNRFTHDESDLVNIQIKTLDDSTLGRSRRLIDKLYENTLQRSLEANLVRSTLEQDNRPLIVCGDLNDIPTSYAYFTLRQKRKDVFLEKGLGLGQTYRNKLPLLRIDYILFDSRFQLHGFEQADVDYSDHEPLLANFSILRDSI